MIPQTEDWHDGSQPSCVHIIGIATIRSGDISALAAVEHNSDVMNVNQVADPVEDNFVTESDLDFSF